MSKKAKAFIADGTGRKCPKCKKPMERRKRVKPPKNNWAYYFEWYDYCYDCNHIQHYETAKRYPKTKQKKKELAKDNISLYCGESPPWLGTDKFKEK